MSPKRVPVSILLRRTTHQETKVGPDNIPTGSKAKTNEDMEKQLPDQASFMITPQSALLTMFHLYVMKELAMLNDDTAEFEVSSNLHLDITKSFHLINVI